MFQVQRRVIGRCRLLMVQFMTSLYRGLHYTPGTKEIYSVVIKVNQSPRKLYAFSTTPLNISLHISRIPRKQTKRKNTASHEYILLTLCTYIYIYIYHLVSRIGNAEGRKILGDIERRKKGEKDGRRKTVACRVEGVQGITR